MMYYVVFQNPRMTRAAVHFGTHDHPIAPDESRKAISEIHDAVKEQVSKRQRQSLAPLGWL